MCLAWIVEDHVKLHAFHTGPYISMDMEFVITNREKSQLCSQVLFIQPQVQHGTKKHVSADAAENIKVERLHAC